MAAKMAKKQANGTRVVCSIEMHVAALGQG